MGLVLLELLTGTKAFPGTAIKSLVARTLRSPKNPDHLGDWGVLLRALTAMDATERPTAADAAAMAAQLVAAVPRGQPGRPVQDTADVPARRHRQQL
jgi:hypothetical protein